MRVRLSRAWHVRTASPRRTRTCIKRRRHHLSSVARIGCQSTSQRWHVSPSCDRRHAPTVMINNQWTAIWRCRRSDEASRQLARSTGARTRWTVTHSGFYHRRNRKNTMKKKQTIVVFLRTTSCLIASVLHSCLLLLFVFLDVYGAHTALLLIWFQHRTFLTSPINFKKQIYQMTLWVNHW